MKLDINILIQYLERLKVLEKSVINFTEDGIKCDGVSPSTVAACQSLLSKTTVTNYSPIGEIGIDDIGLLINKLSRFNGNVELSVNENKFLDISSSNKTMRAILPDISLFKRESKKPNLEYPGFINVPVDIVKEAIKDAEVLGTDEIKFELNNSLLNLISENSEEKYVVSHKLTSPSQEAKVRVPLEYLRAIFENLNEQVEVGIKSDYPLSIKFKNNIFDLTYFIAPKMSDK
mgnify:CR=1 FL=1